MNVVTPLSVADCSVTPVPLPEDVVHVLIGLDCMTAIEAIASLREVAFMEGVTQRTTSAMLPLLDIAGDNLMRILARVS